MAPLAERFPSAITVPEHDQKQLSLVASVGSAPASASAFFSTSLHPSSLLVAASAFKAVTVSALHAVKSQTTSHCSCAHAPVVAIASSITARVITLASGEYPRVPALFMKIFSFFINLLFLELINKMLFGKNYLFFFFLAQGGPPSQSSCSVSARQTRNATMATVSSCERYSRCISPMFDV